MMDSYDLFSAMSGIDEELIARSDYRVKRRKHEFLTILTVAACFAIILISMISLLPISSPEMLHNPPTTVPAETESAGSAAIDPDQPLQLSGSDMGTLNIVQLSNVENAESMPNFLMYINQEKYRVADAAGTYYIYPISVAADQPKPQMTITWQQGISVETAARQQADSLSAAMEHISEPESDPLLGGMMLYGENGGELTEVYLADDLQNGVFIFTLKFYSDDPDDHASWFRDMLQTFEIVTVDREAPKWMKDLQNSVEIFTSAFLKNDFSGTEELIAENAVIWTYGSDVHSETRILQTHYKVDSDTVPTSAYVSVRHKYVENDAYDYITMELKYTGGNWQVTSAVIER